MEKIIINDIVLTDVFIAAIKDFQEDENLKLKMNIELIQSVKDSLVRNLALNIDNPKYVSEFPKMNQKLIELSEFLEKLKK